MKTVRPAGPSTRQQPLCGSNPGDPRLRPGWRARAHQLVNRLGCMVLLAALDLAVTTSYAQPVALVDDRVITVDSSRAVAARRLALVSYLWGRNGFPDRNPDVVLTSAPLPVHHLTDLKRADEFRMILAEDLETVSYHFIAERPNHQLVVVHQGHACTLDDPPTPPNAGYGLQRTIQALLREGYGVLGVYMPRFRPGDCRGNHEALFRVSQGTGSPLRYFLEPTAISLNYLKTQSRPGQFPEYRAYHMMGLSGGGWTTTVYAAIDPTIQCSFPVAGTIPLYLRSGGSIGDREQFETGFYHLAGYPDLYVLGAYGANRKQVQILVRQDDCCFGTAQHDEAATGLPYRDAMRSYETRVQAVLTRIGQGSFQLIFDEEAPRHMVSSWTVEAVILPELGSAHSPLNQTPSPANPAA